jgi:hypothetical protein
MSTEEKLTIVDQSKHFSFGRNGVDMQYGLRWLEFELGQDQDQDQECTICGQHITTGWLCIDSGMCVCHEHVDFTIEPSQQIVTHARVITEETITIIDDGNGIARQSGVDTKNGLHWLEFITEHLAGEIGEYCAICYRYITTGWLCLDSGDCVCRKHVNFVGDTTEIPDYIEEEE